MKETEKAKPELPELYRCTCAEETCVRSLENKFCGICVYYMETDVVAGRGTCLISDTAKDFLWCRTCCSEYAE